MDRERDAERWLVEGVKELGGIAFKWVSPGNAGVPDRIVVLPGGKVYFVEVKKADGVLRPLQRSQIQRLQRLGCHAFVLAGTQDVRTWLQMARMGFEERR